MHCADGWPGGVQASRPAVPPQFLRLSATKETSKVFVDGAEEEMCPASSFLLTRHSRGPQPHLYHTQQHARWLLGSIGSFIRHRASTPLEAQVGVPAWSAPDSGPPALFTTSWLTTLLKSLLWFIHKLGSHASPAGCRQRSVAGCWAGSHHRKAQGRSAGRRSACAVCGACSSWREQQQ